MRLAMGMRNAALVCAAIPILLAFAAYWQLKRPGRCVSRCVRQSKTERGPHVLAPAGTSIPQSLHFLTALVFDLLDFLQAGEVLSPGDIDFLRTLLHKIEGPGLASQLEERSFEPEVEDAIRYTLGIGRPLAVEPGYKEGKLVPNEDYKEADASPRDILLALTHKQSMFHSGPEPRRSMCFCSKEHPFLHRSMSSPRLSHLRRSSSSSHRRSSFHKGTDSCDAVPPLSTGSSTPVHLPNVPQEAEQRWSKPIASAAVSQAGSLRASEELPNASDATRENTSCSSGSNHQSLELPSSDSNSTLVQRRIRFNTPFETCFPGKSKSEDVPRPEPPIMDEVDRLMVIAESSFFFDAFALDKAANGHALSVLGFFLLNQTGLASRFHINLTQLARFLCKIEAGYSKTVPFHNEIHAADVLQTVHAMWCMGGLGAAIADPLLQLAAYLAAIIHDHEHAGLNNTFLIVTESELALRYNDTSPLEQHHLASALSLLKEHKIMASLPKQEFLQFRKVVIDLVLATDMAKHCDFMVALGALATSVSVSSRFEQPAAPTTAGGNQVPLVLDGGAKLLLLQAALKCADLGHTAASLEVHLKWVSLLAKEFHLQGDMEAKLSLPVSPLCDRNHANLQKTQVGFIDFVVAPLFQAFMTVIPDMYPLQQAIESNRRHWAETSN